MKINNQKAYSIINIENSDTCSSKNNDRKKIKSSDQYDLKRDLITLIANNEIGKALNNLKYYFEAHEDVINNDLVLIQSNFNKLRREITLNLISEDMAHIMSSKLNRSILDFIDNNL